MIFDAENLFSNGQVVTGNATSTNVVWLSGSTFTLGGGNQPRAVEFLVALSAVSGSSPTLKVDLQTADDESFSTNVQTAASSGTQAGLTAGRAVKIIPPRALGARGAYCRLYYTVGGSSPSFTINKAGVVVDSPTNVPELLG